MALWCRKKCSLFFLLNMGSTFLSDQCSKGVLFQVLSLILLELTPARLQPASVKRASRLWIMWISDRKWGVWKQRNLSRVYPLHVWTGDKAGLIFSCCNKVLICFLWHDAECHLALRIPFQPKGLKHHIPAVHLSFYTNRRNSRCYHGIPSERWQWAFYRDQWDSYITPHCDLFLHFCALETRWSTCDCGVL